MLGNLSLNIANITLASSKHDDTDSPQELDGGRDNQLFKLKAPEQ
jgi:hypothetical protein